MKNANLAKAKKRLFTLIEIIIALIVVSLLSSVFIVGIRNLWRQQAFLDESHLLLNQLRLAQDMMQIMDADVEVRIKADKEKYVSNIQVKSPPSSLAKTIANSSELEFQNISPLFFEDSNGTVFEDDFVLTFFSRGFVMNRGILKFGPTGEENANTAIILHGFPEPLRLQSLESSPSIDFDKNTMVRLTEATRQETAYEEQKNEPEESEF